MDREFWIFGYGSLVWRPAFPHVERRPARVRDFARRFWQGSPDHRGVPEQPGRVVTLVSEPGAECWGVGYRVLPEARDEVLQRLDVRESGGFERVPVDLHFADPRRAIRRALTYVAGPANPNFLGPAPEHEIADRVRRARGRSGTNAEYVVRLAECLREMAVEDEHVFAVAGLLATGS